jgi:hypothetical protein
MTLPQLSHSERQQRSRDKRAALLAFLASGEVYTTAAVAAKILGLSERRAVTCMQALERDGCIKSEMHHISGRLLKLFGVTPHGLAVAGQFDAPFFELGRTNSSWITHRIETQRMRLAAEAAGWRNWQPERSLRIAGLKKVPDAIATDPAGAVVAIEIERHCKTPKRYAEVISAYLQEVASGRYTRVEFVCPPGVARLVAAAFARIETVKLKGELVRLEPRHHARFTFSDFNNWPTRRVS